MSQPAPSRWRGGDAAPGAHCVLAPNPGPMTLDGTNTWLVSAPGGRACAVVDPGPNDPEHLDAVLAAARERSLRIATVLLTHGHPDHAEGARTLAALAGGVGVRALDPAHRLGAEGLAHDDVVEVDGLPIRVVATPGHTSDSLCFLVDAGSGPAVLTGDTVLGRGTAVVAHPSGRLGDYLDSLRRLEALASELPLTAVWPGHGPVLDAPLDAVRFYLAHRAARLDQVRVAVAAGARTPRAVVERVYADVDPTLWPAAELSVRAQLDYLTTHPVPDAHGGGAKG